MDLRASPRRRAHQQRRRAGAARLAGYRPGAVADARRLSAAAALTSLTRFLCIVSWRTELAGTRGAGCQGGGGEYIPADQLVVVARLAVLDRPHESRSVYARRFLRRPWDASPLFRASVRIQQAYALAALAGGHILPPQLQSLPVSAYVDLQFGPALLRHKQIVCSLFRKEARWLDGQRDQGALSCSSTRGLSDGRGRFKLSHGYAPPRKCVVNID